MELRRLIALAQGQEPADLVLRHARLINVLSHEIQPTDVTIADDLIVGLGPGYHGREETDLAGAFVAPGLIDAHVHLESAKVTPREFARAVVPHGVTTVVSDPHEIANVLGLAGIRFMLDDAQGLPLTVYANASSCVPATHMATAGAALEAADLLALRDDPRVLGLAEMMNFPGVVFGVNGVLAKLEAFRGGVMDGHCPGLSGLPLNAYVAAGIGSDHECCSLAEAQEKLRLGLTIFIREATNARNLLTLLPLVTPATAGRFCWCTDDRNPAHLLHDGSVDDLVRLAIAAGLDPITALRLATLSPAQYFGLRDRGAVAPGRRADLIVFSDLRSPHPHRVYAGGRLVAADGAYCFATPPGTAPTPGSTMHIAWDRVSFAIRAQGRRVRVIGVIPGQLLTEHLVLDAPIRDGLVVAAPAQDLAKMAVIERHRATGNVGLGLIRGLGLQRGALASTVAHDHHNLVVVGTDDHSMMTAARAVAAAGGGQAAALGDHVLALLPLPVAGIMSAQRLEDVEAAHQTLLARTRELGCALDDPFMALSFMALEVIPALKLTDQGLVDVNQFKVVPLFLPE